MFVLVATIGSSATIANPVAAAGLEVECSAKPAFAAFS